MKLSHFKKKLSEVDVPVFELRNGSSVPSHYHLTEVGLVTKEFIDCGGTMRKIQYVSFQLRYSTDVDHRLESKKLLSIIDMFEKKIQVGDIDIYVEYQADTVGVYELDRYNGSFVLIPTKTDCLAKDACGIPLSTSQSDLMGGGSGCCGGGCC